MEQRSIWLASAPACDFPAAAGRVKVNTAIVGGGITGLTCAMLLAREGQQVAVLEAAEIASGTTGASTGNLYPVIGASLASLQEKWGENVLRLVAGSRAFAIDLVERTVAEQQIDCGFARCDWHLFAASGDEEQCRLLDREHWAAMAAGLPARLAEGAPLPFATGATLIVGRAAQLHPAAYVRRLAGAIRSERCRIFEHTPVRDFDLERRLLKTEDAELAAGNIFFASHSPKGFHIVQTALGPYRQYALAARLATGDYPRGIFWSAGQDRHSIRSCRIGGDEHLIVVGRGHKTGQEQHTAACYRRLEDYLGRRFPGAAASHRWSAQGYYAADDLPYIGAAGNAEHVYIATGFADDGLTYGTLAGFIVAAEILGRRHPYADLYKATRVTPVKSAKKVIQENANVLGEYIRDYARREDAVLRDIVPGEGRIVEVGGDKIAAYRDDAGRLSALSPACTHLKCLVDWNEAEKSWDCPCHGSRFGTDGEVIEGPALEPLKRIALPPAA